MFECSGMLGLIVINVSECMETERDFDSLAASLDIERFTRKRGVEINIDGVISLNLADSSYLIRQSPTTKHKHELSAISNLFDTVPKLLYHLKASELPCIVLIRVNTQDSSMAIEPVDCFGLSKNYSSPTAVSLSVEDMMREGLDAYENMDLSVAITAFERIISVQTEHEAALFNLACAYHLAGYPTLSLSKLQALLLLKPDDRTAHSFLWALCGSVPKSMLISVYEVLRSHNDTIAATRLAVLTGKGTLAVRSDDMYVANVFDHLAPIFEEKLTKHLQYDAPWILHRMISDYTQDVNRRSSSRVGSWRILDLGCGSGLCGKVFQPFYQHANDSTNPSLEEAFLSNQSILIGVDVSSKMIDICRALNLYHSLHCLDLITTLRTCLNTPHQTHNLFDLVIAADTFVYVGALGEVFYLTKQVLSVGGLFAFSTEDLDTSPMRLLLPNESDSDTLEEEVVLNEFELAGAVPGWGGRLLTSARFGHSNTYIEKLCEKHGFEIVQHEVKTLRMEETTPLPGNMFVLRKL